MFIQEMIRLAYELTMQNIKWSKISQALKERGCPVNIADNIAKGVENQRKSAMRKTGGRNLLLGIGALVVGLIITTISYNAASSGGHYWVMTGLFAYSAYAIIRGLYFLISGRAPKSN